MSIKKIPVYLFALISFLFSCFDIHEPDFNKIKDYKLRIIGSTIEPNPNVLPGDTIRVKFVFAGNDVVDVYDWKILYGNMFKYDGEERIRRTDYENVNILGIKKWLPDSIEVTIVLDSNIINSQAEHNYNLSEKTLELDSLVYENRKSNGLLYSNMNEEDKDSLEKLLINTILPGNLLFNALSENGTILEIKKTIPITYRKEFSDLIEPACNPKLKWIAIYSVPEENKNEFEQLILNNDNSLNKNYLLNEEYPESVNTDIIVQKGRTYFLVGDQSYLYNENVDIYGSITWFYQNIEEDGTNNSKVDELFDIDEDGQCWTLFNPPTDKSMRSFKIWAYSNANVNYIDGHSITYCTGKFIY